MKGYMNEEGETKDQIVHTMLKYTAGKLADLLASEENTETAILDTGCARSASGRHWIEAHIRGLSQRDRSDIKRRKGRATFRFGNGRTYKSEELIILPVYFGEHRAMMAVDVVEVKIPLLISIAAMKKAKTVIRTATDTATICGQCVKLTRIGGHYTLSLRKGEAEIMKEEPIGKGTMDNIHIDKQKEETPKAQITKTSPV